MNCTRGGGLTFPGRTYTLRLQQISTNIINVTTQSAVMYTDGIVYYVYATYIILQVQVHDIHQVYVQ